MERDCQQYERSDLMDTYEQEQADKQIAERLIPRKGHVVAMITIPPCDICGQPATWDVPTVHGPWAYLCDEHAQALHVWPGATGVGLGQRIVAREEQA